MTKITEIESFQFPSMKSYKPKKKKDRSLFFLALAFVAVLGIWFLEATFLKVEAAEVSPVKNEAEWEKEICGDLEKYSNHADFQAYCDYRLTN